MGRALIVCILANLACVAACAALLLFYPHNSGFTITTSTRTHYFPGGALLCLFNLAIGAYLAWSLLHPR